MQRTRTGFGAEGVVAREAKLERRLEMTRVLVAMTGVTGGVAFVIAILAYRDFGAALVAGIPLAVALVATGWRSVTSLHLRKVRLLLAVLGVEGRGAETPGASGELAALKGPERQTATCDPVWLASPGETSPPSTGRA